MMNDYKKITLNLQQPLAFWSAFAASDERVFWYNSQKNEWIIGAERLKKLENESEIKNFPYSFYSRHFFDSCTDELWQDFGNELIAFKHYFVCNEQESSYYYWDKAQPIADVAPVKFEHQLTEVLSNLTEWQELFEQIQAKIASGAAEKIVASRRLEFDSANDFQLESILQRLIEQNPGCYIFAYQKGQRTFLGASPEILVEKENENILSFALAGTISRNIPQAGEKLLRDAKNLAEHDIVVRKIARKMREYAPKVRIGATKLMALKNVYHLHTLLMTESPDSSLIQWAERLHPTPALGGEPSAVALALLRQAEHHERGLYAAPLGFIDQKGNGSLVVGIRSALLVGRKLYAYAGCGIVAASDCASEFAETQVKLKTILEAL